MVSLNRSLVSTIKKPQTKPQRRQLNDSDTLVFNKKQQQPHARHISDDMRRNLVTGGQGKTPPSPAMEMIMPLIFHRSAFIHDSLLYARRTVAHPLPAPKKSLTPHHEIRRTSAFEVDADSYRCLEVKIFDSARRAKCANIACCRRQICR